MVHLYFDDMIVFMYISFITPPADMSSRGGVFHAVMLGIYYWIVDEVLLQAKKGGDESWILLAMTTGCRWDLSRGIAKAVPHDASDQRPDSSSLKVMFSLPRHLGVWLSSSLYAHGWTSFSLTRRKQSC